MSMSKKQLIKCEHSLLLNKRPLQSHSHHKEPCSPISCRDRPYWERSQRQEITFECVRGTFSAQLITLRQEQRFLKYSTDGWAAKQLWQAEVKSHSAQVSEEKWLLPFGNYPPFTHSSFPRSSGRACTALRCSASASPSHFHCKVD